MLGTAATHLNSLPHRPAIPDMGGNPVASPPSTAALDTIGGAGRILPARRGSTASKPLLPPPMASARRVTRAEAVCVCTVSPLRHSRESPRSPTVGTLSCVGAVAPDHGVP